MRAAEARSPAGRLRMPALALALGLSTSSLLAFAPARGQLLRADFPEVNGDVFATAVDADTLYVGGDFTWVGTRVGRFVGLDYATARPVPKWPRIDAPSLYEATCYTCAADGSGGWYVGGFFSDVAGVARYNLAHILADGSLDPWNPPSPSGAIIQMAVQDSVLYIVGPFAYVGAVPRQAAAALNRWTGELLPWDPEIDSYSETVSSVVPHGSDVILGGYFSGVGGVPRNGLAAVDARTGAVEAWDPDVAGTVDAVIIRDSTLYVAGSFSSVGGQPRNNLAAVDLRSGSVLPWAPTVDNVVTAMATDGTTAYLSGAFTVINGAPRSCFAAIDLASGALTGWNPGANAYASSLVLRGGTLYATGPFTSAGGARRLGLAAFDASSGAVTPWDPSCDTNGQTFLAAGDSALMVCGGLAAVNLQARQGAAAFDLTTDQLTPWNPGILTPRAILPRGRLVYLGGNGGLVATRRGTGSIQSQLGGDLYALAARGSTIYVGGTSVLPDPTATVAAVDSASMLPLAWKPGIDGPVYALSLDDTLLYVGGDFHNAGAEPRQRIAAFHIPDLTLTGWNPGVDGPVKALLARGPVVYVGGSFSHVAGAPSSYLAALDAASAGVLPWHPVPMSAVSGLLAMPGRVFVSGGSFNQGFLFAFDSTTASSKSWSPDPSDQVNSISLHGTDLCVGGNFASLSGQPRLCLGVVSTRDSIPVVASLTSPGAGELVPIGSRLPIRWSAGGGVGIESVDLAISRTDSSGPWESIAEALPNTGEYDWVPSGPVSLSAWLMVTARTYAGASASGLTRGPISLVQTTLGVPRPEPGPLLAMQPPSPNPSADQVHVRLILGRSGAVSVSVYDVHGRQVRRTDSWLEAGAPVVELRLGGLHPGLYFVSARSGSARVVSRVVLVR